MKEIIPQSEGSLFSDYIVKKSFSPSSGRWVVALTHKGNSQLSTSMFYSRYIVCLQKNRILCKEEVVDHIDGNKLNDSIDNLEIVTNRENLQRFHRMNPDHCKGIQRKSNNSPKKSLKFILSYRVWQQIKDHTNYSGVDVMNWIRMAIVEKLNRDKS